MRGPLSSSRARATAALGRLAATACLLAAPTAARGFGEAPPDIPRGSVQPPSQEEATRPIGRPPSIELVFLDVQDVFGRDLESLAEEVGGLFRGWGIGIEWRKARAGAPHMARSGELPVVIVKQPQGTVAAGRRKVLGLVPTNGTRGVWAFTDNIRATLGQDARTAWLSPRQQRDLILATSRVVAHENVHTLAPDQPHTTDGLMRDTLDRERLLSAHPPLRPECLTAVLAALGSRRASDPILASGTPLVVP
jgi:hypothetical protein